MGIDTRITLPHNVRVRDVANVLGVLLGCTPEKRYFDEASPEKGWSTVVKGVSVRPNHDIPECCDIAIDCPTGRFEALYHFESLHGRTLLLRSYARTIALGVGLVRFFGGEVDYRDCDQKTCDFVGKAKPENHAEDGKPWYRLQERILNLKPLSKQDFQEFEQYAAYCAVRD